MSLSTVALTITRTELSLADLDLNADPYEVRGFDPAAVAINRIEAKSVFLEGAAYVHTKRDQVDNASTTIWVTADTFTNLQSNIQTLINAFSQTEYTLTLTLDSVDFGSWTAYRADYSAEFGQKEFWHNLKVPITFTFPRYPVAVSGPL